MNADINCPLCPLLHLNHSLTHPTCPNAPPTPCQATPLRLPSCVSATARLTPASAIVANGFVYVSGQLGMTPDGKMVEGPIANRVVSTHSSSHQNQIMDNMDAVLKAHGSGLEHVVKTLIFVGWSCTY